MPLTNDDKWLEFCKQARTEAVIGALSDLKRDIDENAYDMATVSRIIDKHLNEAKYVKGEYYDTRRF